MTSFPRLVLLVALGALTLSCSSAADPTSGTTTTASSARSERPDQQADAVVQLDSASFEDYCSSGEFVDLLASAISDSLAVPRSVVEVASYDPESCRAFGGVSTYGNVSATLNLYSENVPIARTHDSILDEYAGNRGSTIVTDELSEDHYFIIVEASEDSSDFDGAEFARMLDDGQFLRWIVSVQHSDQDTGRGIEDLARHLDAVTPDVVERVSALGAYDEQASDMHGSTSSEALTDLCLGQGFSASTCRCFTSGLESVAPDPFIDDLITIGPDAAALGAFGFSLWLLGDGCRAATTSLDSVEPSPDLIDDLADSCATSGYFDSSTCRCIAAATSRGLSTSEREDLQAAWLVEFDPYAIERLAAGCSHLVFEIQRGRTLAAGGVPPARPGFNDPDVWALFEAAQTLPAIAAQTEVELFEQMISTCNVLDNGDTPQSLIGYFLSNDDYETFRGSLAVLSMSGIVCPEHRDDIAAAIDSLEA